MASGGTQEWESEEENGNVLLPLDALDHRCPLSASNPSYLDLYSSLELSGLPPPLERKLSIEKKIHPASFRSGYTAYIFLSISLPCQREA